MCQTTQVSGDMGVHDGVTPHYIGGHIFMLGTWWMSQLLNILGSVLSSSLLAQCAGPKTQLLLLPHNIPSTSWTLLLGARFMCIGPKLPMMREVCVFWLYCASHNHNNKIDHVYWSNIWGSMMVWYPIGTHIFTLGTWHSFCCRIESFRISNDWHI